MVCHRVYISHALNMSFVSSLVSVSVFSSTMLESYSALLKSLQEVIHKKGFDLTTPMVRSESEFGSFNFIIHVVSGVMRVSTKEKKKQILELQARPPSGLSHPTHHFSPMCLPFSHLLNLASPVCPSCVCLTSDTHPFNNHHISRNPESSMAPSVSQGPNVIMLILP